MTKDQKPSHTRTDIHIFWRQTHQQKSVSLGKRIWRKLCCKSFTLGRLLRDQLVLKCSHEGAAALIILKQWHPYSEEQKSHFFEASSSMVVVARFCLWPCLFPLLVNHGAKVRRQLSAYHIFPINSQPPPLEPPRMVIFHFTKVTRSENCGQSGRPALNWGRRLPAVSETPHKDTDRLFAKHPGFGFAQLFDPIFFRCNFPFLETGGVFLWQSCCQSRCKEVCGISWEAMSAAVAD